MDGSVIVKVFEWRGRFHWYAVREYPTPRSRVARRVRLRSDSTAGEGFATLHEAMLECVEWMQVVAGAARPPSGT